MGNRLHIVRQHDSMQCGAACLCMIAGYFGRHIALDDADSLCQSTNRGVSMWAISQAAPEIGLRTQSLKMTVESLGRLKYPAILFWDQKHFVVYHGKTLTNRYRIADPGKGKYTTDRSGLKEHWAKISNGDKRLGMAMIFACGETDNSRFRKNGNDHGTFSHIKSFFSKYKIHLGLICLALLIGSVLQMTLPFLTKTIVDKGINGKNIPLIWLILCGEVMMVSGSAISGFIRRWLMLHISVRVNLDLINSYLAKLTRLPMSFFDTKLLGDLMQRASDHSRVQSFLTGETLNIIFTTFNFIAFGVALFVLSHEVFLIYVACTVVYALWIIAFLRKRKMLDFEYFEKNCINQNITFEFMTSLPEIKLQGCAGRRRKLWSEAQKDLFSTQLKSLRLGQTQEAGNVLINEIKNVVITVVSATAVINDIISFGDMLAIQYIIGQLNAPVALVVGFINSLQDVRISLDRINEIHYKNDEDNDRHAELKDVLSEGIKIKDLSFKYDKTSDHPVISKMNLDIPVGKTTAIVGLSGSGKSTLLKLILGFYDSYDGEITVDGISLRELNMASWRNRCGIVMQNGIIFSESIARNIAVDDNEIDEERLKKAAQIANILEFIESQPLKFNTEIGRNGKGISEGQKQRILIARAVYKNPDFVFFDEATNSLDSLNESSIVDSLSTFFKDKTVILIAHRLSTIKNADQIIVLENGKITESGAHKDLTGKRGRYYNLVRHQMETIN